MNVTGNGSIATATGTASAAESVRAADTASQAAKSIAICDTQPVTAEGIRNLLRGIPDLKFLTAPESLQQAAEVVRQQRPDVLILDKGFGIQAVLDWLAEIQTGDGTPLHTGMIVWGVSVTEAEALRFLQAGARGILRKSAGVQAVVACLRTVGAGRSWMEDCVFRDSSRSDRYPRSELTAREQQVLELVEQGFKNKEIAGELGIRPGTVKIHLKHIFEKTGVRGRYGLALNGLRDRGLVSLPA
jgi:two-component system nitrate/nitrite response regulator NarL